MIEREIYPLWEELYEFADEIHDLFSERYIQVDNPKHDQQFEGWEDSFWTGMNIRKCHLKTIITDKMWLMHINIFPKSHRNLPILGFDIVANKNRISGSFFDFSPINDTENELDLFYKDVASGVEWNMKRNLPDWAKEIFSENMIACGGLKQGNELNKLKEVTMLLMEKYTHFSNDNDSVTMTENSNIERHNKYCANQKTNVRLHTAIDNMGISEENKMRYINNVLFEEIPIDN